MVIETHVKFCKTVVFSRKKFFPKIEIMDRKLDFLIEKLGHSFLLNLCYNENLFVLFLYKSHTWQNFPKICAKMFSANQIAGLFDQPFIFPEQISEIAWVFYMLIRVHIDQKLIKKILGGHGQKEVWPGHETLKSTVSRKWTDGVNRFLCMLCKFRKAKSWFSNFWVGIWFDDILLLFDF